MNTLTDWLDAGQVYGNEERETELLRSKKDGLLKISNNSEKNLLPKCNENIDDGDINDIDKPLETCTAGCGSDPPQDENPCFAAGNLKSSKIQ